MDSKGSAFGGDWAAKRTNGGSAPCSYFTHAPTSTCYGYRRRSTVTETKAPSQEPAAANRT